MSGSQAAPTHVVFLRAINVGGRRLTMAELVAAVEPLGFASVATWQATGNLVIADDPDRDPEGLARDVRAALRDRLDLDVPAYVRSVAAVRRLAAATPFDEATLAATDRRVQVLLLGEAPDVPTIEAVLALVPDDEHARVDRDHLWWLPRRGVSDSTFPIPKVERLLGGGTMRTQRAVVGLVSRFLAD